jgi:SAM-dependent methyltransferase
MPGRSDVVGARWLGGYRYEALDPDFDFGAALAVCDLRFEEFVFVDIGAGLGRALFLAAELPFKQLVGVEYSAELAAAARENLARSTSPSVARTRITLVHADAVEYELPTDPLVLFLFNPFARDVMAEFIERTRASFQAHPRRLVVVYLNPQFGDQWRNAGFVFHVADTSGASVFDTVSPTDPEAEARRERGREVTAPGSLLPSGDAPTPGRAARTEPRPSSRDTPSR